MKIDPPPTYIERLFLDRRRRGETLSEAATRHGLPLRRYLLCENGFRTNLPAPKITDLSPEEFCVLMRRRAGKLQREVAEAIGRSRILVVHMERGEAPLEELLRYWGV